MIFDIFNTKKKKSELVADSIGKFLSYEIVLIEKMIKGNKKVEIVDIFSLGYTFYLSLTSAIKEGLEGDDAFYAAMGVLIGVFKYKSEREQQRLFNRIKTLSIINSILKN